MSEHVVIPKADWIDILDGVREKTGKTDALVSGQVRAEIDSISVGSEGNTLNEYLKGEKLNITADDLAGITTFRAYAFYYAPITSVDIPYGVQQISRGAFFYCGSLTTATIPGSVALIDRDAFNNCTSLMQISIPNSVTRIGETAFRNCSSLTSIHIPESVNSFGEDVFRQCTNLITATILSTGGLTFNLFNSCTKLEDVTIGGNVTSIGRQAFLGCTSLMKVVCLAEIPPTLDASSFNNVPADCIFKVKSASVEAYKSATNWSVRADYIIALTPEEEALYGG